MRNLKKILALVLALVMSLSLMATASATDTTAENTESPYQTAVDVLKGVGVVKGDDRGDRLTDPITRAEVTALLYRIATGDVADAQKNIHTGVSFTDVNIGDWYTGYISYCYIAEIIKGNPNGTFEPDENINGYATLAMILRAMGYDKKGEFVGDGWEIRTASTAKQIGILEGITDTQLSGNASRALVFQILFRAIFKDIVRYNALHEDYDPTGETLAKNQLGLEEITGIITANEYADLYGASPMPKNKTRLVGSDKTYNLDYSTDLTQIGEKHIAYIQNNTKVLGMESTGNTTWENGGKAADISTGGKFANVTGLSRGGENYVNFGGDGDVYKSEYRIAYLFSEFNYWYVSADDSAEALEILKKTLKDEYNISASDSEISATPSKDEDGNVIAGRFDLMFKSKSGIKRSFAPDDAITQEDMNCIRDIFYYADRLDKDLDGSVVLGEVYVGTKSTEDISDKISYRQFMDDYIEDVTSYERVTSADNGEWLKVIDNNGDGVADYVFLTTFVMTTVVDYNSRLDIYTVEYTKEQVAGEELTVSNGLRNPNGSVVLTGAKKANRVTINGYEISTEIEEIAEGDVILYTKIDGVYHVTYPEVETNAIDKKGIDYKAETFTCGDKTYEWSGIDYEAYGLYHDVSEAKTQTNYDFYLDHFGYIRLYTESIYNQGFVLLTDGYFETDRRTDGYKAQIWNRETEDYEDVVVLNPSNAPAKTFIDNEYDVGNKREEGTWKRLLEFGQVYKDFKYDEDTDPFRTNIAAYSVNENGEYVLLPVQSASNRIVYKTHELNLDSGNGTAISPKARTIYCLNDSTRIQTTNDTVYYYVLNPGTSSEKIISWVGYNNAPSSVSLSLQANHVDHAYAVTTPAYTDASYETAEVVVFEAKGWTQTAIMAYALDQKMIGENRTFDIYGLGYDDEAGAYGPTVVTGKVTDQTNGKTRTIDEKYAPWKNEHLIEFYTVDSDGATLNLLSAAYAKDQPGVYEDYGVYAGYVTTAEKVQNRDYITLSKDGSKNTTSHSFFPDSTPTYVVTYSPSADAQLDYVWTSNTVREERIGNVRTTYDVAESNAFSAGRVNADGVTLKDADQVIYVTDGRGNVLYAINVTESQYYNSSVKDYVGIPALEELWQQIADDYADDHQVKTPDITFTDATVKGQEVKNGKVTLTTAQAKEMTDTAKKVNLTFKTNADRAIVVTQDGTSVAGSITAGVWKNTTDGAITANTTYTILLQKAGCDDVTETIAVTVAEAGSNAAITSLKIKGVEVTGADIPALAYGAATINKPIVVEYDDALDATINQVEVTTADPGATWSVAGGSAIALDSTPITNANYSTIKTAMTPDASATDIVITVTAEDGRTTGVYTLASVTTKDAPLTFAGDSTATDSQYKVGTGSLGAVSTTAAKIGYGKDITIAAALSSTDKATKEITEVSYTIDGANKKVLTADADGNYVIKAADLEGKTGDIVVTVTSAAYTLKAKKVGGGDLAAVGNVGTTAVDGTTPIAIGTSDTAIPKTQDLVFTVAVSASTNLIDKVEWRIGATGQLTEIKAGTDGKYTIAKENLTGNVEIVVTEVAKVAFTGAGTLAETIKIDVGDGAGYVAGKSANKSVKPGTVVSVLVPAYNQPTVDDATKGIVSDTYRVSGENWIWTITVNDAVQLTGMIEVHPEA